MAAVALSVLLASFALGASSASGELCSVLLQTKTAQSSLPEQLQSNLAELDDFERSLEDLQTATQELATDRSSSRRRTSSLQLTSAQDEQLDSASEEGQIVTASLLRNTTASNANASNANALLNTTAILSNVTHILSNLTSSAEERAYEMVVAWDRVCTAAAIVVALQIFVFTSIYYGGDELFGEYRFMVLRFACLYTSLPLLVYFFYETGVLSQTFDAAVPFLAIAAVIGMLVIPLVIECVLEVHQGWKEFADELSFVIKLQRRIARNLHIEAVDQDGDGDVDCRDYVQSFRKKHGC